METLNLSVILEQIKTTLEQKLSRLVFDTWIKPVEIITLTDTYIELGTPKQIMKEWIESRYFNLIQDIAREIIGRPINLIITNMNINDEDTIPAVI